MEHIIDIQHLNYRYNNNFKALDDVSIQVPKGAIYGFLGPNGAGKSTTMRMLAGLMPDEGNNIKLFGKPLMNQLPSVFQQMGCLVEQPVLYQHLTANDHLVLICKQNKVSFSKIEEVLQMVGLSHAKKLAVKRYSLGMKQRLAIALCLIKNPTLLLLDEPVNGLDPNGMLEVRNLLLRLNEEHGITIFISSHLLSELEKMCSHICIIHKGKIHFEGTMVSLKAKFEATPVKICIGKTDQQLDFLPIAYQQQGDNITVQIANKEEIPGIIQLLVENKIPVYSVQQEGNLESWFMDIVK